jgi:hypothetical protein
VREREQDAALRLFLGTREEEQDATLRLFLGTREEEQDAAACSLSRTQERVGVRAWPKRNGIVNPTP